MNQPSDKTSQGEASKAEASNTADAANYNFLIGQEETVKGYRTPENPLLATGSLTVTDYGYFITGTKETVEKYVNINAKVGYEDLLKNTNLLVTDAKSAKKSIEHIDREIENLAKIRDKLSDFSQSLSVQKNGKDSENTLNDSDGLKNKLPKYGAPDHYGQRGGSKFIADIRLQQIESPMDAMLNSVDSLFKDSIYKNLGLGLCWSMVAGETAALA